MSLLAQIERKRSYAKSSSSKSLLDTLIAVLKLDDCDEILEKDPILKDLLLSITTVELPKIKEEDILEVSNK